MIAVLRSQGQDGVKPDLKKEMTSSNNAAFRWVPLTSAMRLPGIDNPEAPPPSGWHQVLHSRVQPCFQVTHVEKGGRGGGYLQQGTRPVGEAGAGSGNNGLYGRGRRLAACRRRRCRRRRRCGVAPLGWWEGHDSRLHL